MVDVILDGASEPLRDGGPTSLELARTGTARVVVHVGGTDETSHRRDRPAKIASIETADRQLVAAHLAQAGLPAAIRVAA